MAQVTQVEHLLQARLSVSQGQVVTRGLGGVGRTDTVSYPVAGYNGTYGVHELQADATGHFTLALDAAGGDIRNPVFLVHGMAGEPTSLTLDGTALAADQDYFASYDASTGSVWLTINRLWSGSHTLRAP